MLRHINVSISATGFLLLATKSIFAIFIYLKRLNIFVDFSQKNQQNQNPSLSIESAQRTICKRLNDMVTYEGNVVTNTNVNN